MSNQRNHASRKYSVSWNPARMRTLRRKRGMTMTELAELLHTTVPTVKRYESGEVEPKINRVVQIARVLATSVSYLVGETKEDDTALALRDLRPKERELIRAFRDNDLKLLNTIMNQEARKQMLKK